MTKQRADLGFSDTFEAVKPSDFPVPFKDPIAPPSLPARDIREVAHASGFTSREATSVAPAPVAGEGSHGRRRRIYRTGRREQLNIKVRDLDLTNFYQVCDQQNWVQGYAFQRALEALDRELKGVGHPTLPDT